jgi:uncharacterized protein (DUF2141 family)
MYAPTQYEITVAANASLAAAAADVGTWAPGYMPVTVRALAVVIDTLTNAAGTVMFEKRTTFKSDSGRTTIATLTIPNAQAAGSAIYKHGIATSLTPGQEIVARVQTTAGNGKANCIIMVENSPEVPGNITAMKAG